MTHAIPIGIIGIGMVGSQVERWFREVRGYRRGVDLFCFDANPVRGYTDDMDRAHIIFVCVPTPPARDGSCDTSIVEQVIASIPNDRIVVIKSTVPPGTTQWLQNKRLGLRLMFNPEFLTVSTAWTDFIKPDRQIIGVTKQSRPIAYRVVNFLPRGHASPNEMVTSTEAEFVKNLGNFFGALKVDFANVAADLCHAYASVHGEPVDDAVVRNLLAADPRIGPTWLEVNHGGYNGFGGGCLPKDSSALLVFFRKLKAMFIDRGLPNGGVIRARTLQEGLTLFQQVCDYNEQLLMEQNLTVADVSALNNKDAILRKRRKVRI